jgi:hypothetical protein
MAPQFLPPAHTVHLYRLLQLDVFVCCPFTRASTRSADAGVQDIIPSFITLLFIRPGTSAAIAAQSLPPCICTESFSLLSSSFVHLPARAVDGSMLFFKMLCHLVQHSFCVRPGTSAAILSQFLPPCICTDSLSLLSSTTVH